MSERLPEQGPQWPIGTRVLLTEVRDRIGRHPFPTPDNPKTEEGEMSDDQPEYPAEPKTHIGEDVEAIARERQRIAAEVCEAIGSEIGRITVEGGMVEYADLCAASQRAEERERLVAAVEARIEGLQSDFREADTDIGDPELSDDIEQSVVLEGQAMAIQELRIALAFLKAVPKGHPDE